MHILRKVQKGMPYGCRCNGYFKETQECDRMYIMFRVRESVPEGCIIAERPSGCHSVNAECLVLVAFWNRNKKPAQLPTIRRPGRQYKTHGLNCYIRSNNNNYTSPTSIEKQPENLISMVSPAVLAWYTKAYNFLNKKKKKP